MIWPTHQIHIVSIVRRLIEQICHGGVELANLLLGCVELGEGNRKDICLQSFEARLVGLKLPEFLNDPLHPSTLIEFDS